MKTSRRKADIVLPERIAVGTAKGTYSPTWAPLRPNADQHEQIPSRHNGFLYYRDGRKEAV